MEMSDAGAESGGARLRRLHALLCKEDVDAAAVILGIDAQHSPACLAAACYLVPSLTATLRDTAVLDDCVFVIHTHPQLQLHVIAPPAACPTILAHCRNLPGFQLHASVGCASRFLATQANTPQQLRTAQQRQRQRQVPEGGPEDEEEEEAIELYKALTFVNLMRDKQRVALPFAGKKPATVEGWPLVQATALEHFGAGGFFTLVHNIIDLSQILDPLHCALDAEACRHLAATHLPSFTAAWSAASTAFRKCNTSPSQKHSCALTPNTCSLDAVVSVDSNGLQAAFQEHFHSSTARPGSSNPGAHHGAHGAHEKPTPARVCDCATKQLFTRLRQSSSAAMGSDDAGKLCGRPQQRREAAAMLAAAAKPPQAPTAVRIAVQQPDTPLRCARTWLALDCRHSSTAVAGATLSQLLRYTAHVFERDAHDIARMAIIHNSGSAAAGGVGEYLTAELRAAFPSIDMDPLRATSTPLSAEGLPHPCTHGPTPSSATATDTGDVALLPTEAAVYVEVVFPRIAVRDPGSRGGAGCVWEAVDVTMGDTLGIAHCSAAHNNSDGGHGGREKSANKGRGDIVRADVLTRGAPACCVAVHGDTGAGGGDGEGGARPAGTKQQQGGGGVGREGEAMPHRPSSSTTATAITTTTSSSSSPSSATSSSRNRGGVLRIGGFSLTFPGEETAPSLRGDSQRPNSINGGSGGSGGGGDTQVTASTATSTTHRPSSGRRGGTGRAAKREMTARLLLADGEVERGLRICFNDGGCTLYTPLSATTPMRLAVASSEEARGNGRGGTARTRAGDARYGGEGSGGSSGDGGGGGGADGEPHYAGRLTAAWMGKTRDRFVLGLSIEPQAQRAKEKEREQQPAVGPVNGSSGGDGSGMVWLRASAWPTRIGQGLEEAEKRQHERHNDEGDGDGAGGGGDSGDNDVICIVLVDDVQSTLHHTISRQVFSSWKATIPFQALPSVPSSVARALTAHELADRHALHPSFLKWKGLCDVLRGAIVPVKELRLLMDAVGVHDHAGVLQSPQPPSSSSSSPSAAVQSQGVAAHAVVDVCVVLASSTTPHTRLAHVFQAVTDHSPGVVIANCSMYAATASHVSAVASSLVATVARHLNTDRHTSTSTSSSTVSTALKDDDDDDNGGGSDGDVAGAQAIVALHTHLAAQQVVATLHAATTTRVRLSVAAVVCATTALDLWPAPREFELRPPLSPQLHSAHCTHCLVAPTPKAVTQAGVDNSNASSPLSPHSKRVWVNAEDASAALRMLCPASAVVRLSDTAAVMDALLDCLNTRPYSHAARVLLRYKSDATRVDVLATPTPGIKTEREEPGSDDDGGIHTFVVEGATAAVVRAMVNSLRTFALSAESAGAVDDNAVIQLYHSDGRIVTNATCVTAWRAYHTTTAPAHHHPHTIATHGTGDGGCVCFATVCSAGQTMSRQQAEAVVKQALLAPLHEPSSSPLAAGVQVTKQQREKLNAELSGHELPKGWYYTGHQYVSMEGHRQAEHPLLEQRVEQWRKEEEENQQQTLSQLKAVSFSAHEAPTPKAQSPPSSATEARDVTATTPSPRPPKTPPPSSSTPGRRHLLQPRPPTGRVRGRRVSHHTRKLPSVNSSPSKQSRKAPPPPSSASSSSTSNFTSSPPKASPRAATTPTPPPPPTATTSTTSTAGGGGGGRVRTSSTPHTRRFHGRT